MASLAAVVLCGPVGAALVSCGTLLGVRRGPSVVQRLFNTAMYVLSAYLAGRTFLAFGGPVGTPGQSSFPGLIGPFAAAAVVHVAVNFMLLHGVFWVTREPGGGATRGLHEHETEPVDAQRHGHVLLPLRQEGRCGGLRHRGEDADVSGCKRMLSV